MKGFGIIIVDDFNKDLYNAIPGENKECFMGAVKLKVAAAVSLVFMLV
jgi:hypothetical protein